MQEIHLFIIWENARYKEDELINVINRRFTILQKRYITWSSENFSSNLSRFYGTKLPDRSAKEQHIGKGEFLLIIVQDDDPKYTSRHTSKGIRIVNINMFDTKQKLREMTGGGHKIHGTDSVTETNHDLTLLIGKNVCDYLNTYQKNMKDIYNENRDLFGCHGWKSVEDIFYVLNNCTEYAVMRNHESLPKEIYVTDHNDIDILCQNKDDCVYALNAKAVFNEKYRVHYFTSLYNGKKIYFDVRYIGDNYYCLQLEIDMLNTKELSEKGFYVLNDEYYYYTLLYHAFIQKPEMKEDYLKRLQLMRNISLNTNEKIAKNLSSWLISKDYYIIKPYDKSVYFNKDHLEYFNNSVYQENTTIDLLEEYYLDVIEIYKDKIIKLEQQNNELRGVIHRIMNSRRMKLFSWVDKFKKEKRK